MKTLLCLLTCACLGTAAYVEAKGQRCPYNGPKFEEPIEIDVNNLLATGRM